MTGKKSKWEDGLGKQCTKHDDWTRCSCPWWGKYKGIRRSLAKWARTRIESKTLASKILNRFKAEIDKTGTTGKHEGLMASVAMTVAELVKLYQDKYVDVQGLADKSMGTALKRIAVHFGPLPLSALTSSGPIEDWIGDMRVEGLSARSQKCYASHLRGVLNWAKSRELIPRTGFDSKSIRFGKDASRKRVLQEGEEAALLGACERMNTKVHYFAGPIMLGRLVCALDLGLRQGTMLRLQNKHIDFEDWVLHIPAAIAKDDEDLELPIESKRLRKFLNTRRLLGPEAYPFGHGLGNKRFKNGSFQNNFSKTAKALFRLAGIEFGQADMVWHDFRHDMATLLTTDLGTPLPVAKEITGHSETRMLERYINPRMKAKREALRRLAATRVARLEKEELATKEAAHSKASGE